MDRPRQPHAGIDTFLIKVPEQGLPDVALKVHRQFVRCRQDKYSNGRNYLCRHPLCPRCGLSGRKKLAKKDKAIVNDMMSRGQELTSFVTINGPTCVADQVVDVLRRFKQELLDKFTEELPDCHAFGEFELASKAWAKECDSLGSHFIDGSSGSQVSPNHRNTGLHGRGVAGIQHTSIKALRSRYGAGEESCVQGVITDCPADQVAGVMVHVHIILEHAKMPRKELNGILKKLFPGHKRVKVEPITDHVNKWTGEFADGVRKVLEYLLDKSGSTKGRTRELKGKANRKGLHGFETRAVFEGYCRIVGGTKSRRKLAFEYNMAGLIQGDLKIVTEQAVAVCGANSLEFGRPEKSPEMNQISTAFKSS
jgi:hypothetical protein